MKKVRNFSFFLIALSSAMWAVDGVFFTPRYFSMNLYNTAVIVLLAHLFPTIALLIYTPKKIITIFKNFKLNDYIKFIIISLFGGTIGTIAIVKALALVEFKQFSMVALIQQLQPIFAAILAMIYLKEKPKKSFFSVLIISIISVYLLKFGFRNPTTIGKIEFMAVFYALLAAVSFGASTVLSRKLVTDYDYYTTMFCRFLFTTLTTSLIVILNKSELETLKYAFTNKEIIINALIIAVWGLLALTIYCIGMIKTTALHATLSELSFPVLSVILNIIAHDAKFNTIQIISASILVASVLYYNLQKK